MEKVLTENRYVMFKKNRYPNTGRQIDINIARQTDSFFFIID